MSKNGEWIFMCQKVLIFSVNLDFKVIGYF